MNYVKMSHALTRHVPSIRRNAFFVTDHGELSFDGADSKLIGDLVERILKSRMEANDAADNGEPSARRKITIELRQSDFDRAATALRDAGFNVVARLEGNQ